MPGVVQISYKKPRFVQKCPRILDLSLYVRSVQILPTAVRGATAPSLPISILDPLSAQPKFCGSPLAARRLQFAIPILALVLRVRLLPHFSDTMYADFSAQHHRQCRDDCPVLAKLYSF